jgi:hypothetical protein
MVLGREKRVKLNCFFDKVRDSLRKREVKSEREVKEIVRKGQGVDRSTKVVSRVVQKAVVVS